MGEEVGDGFLARKMSKGWVWIWENRRDVKVIRRTCLEEKGQPKHPPEPWEGV